MQLIEIVMMTLIASLGVLVAYMSFLLQKQTTEEEKLKKSIVYYFAELIKPCIDKTDYLDDEVQKLSIQITTLRGRIENLYELVDILRGDIEQIEEDMGIPRFKIK